MSIIDSASPPSRRYGLTPPSTSLSASGLLSNMQAAPELRLRDPGFEIRGRRTPKAQRDGPRHTRLNRLVNYLYSAMRQFSAQRHFLFDCNQPYFLPGMSGIR